MKNTNFLSLLFIIGLIVASGCNTTETEAYRGYCKVTVSGAVDKAFEGNASFTTNGTNAITLTNAKNTLPSVSFVPFAISGIDKITKGEYPITDLYYVPSEGNHYFLANFSFQSHTDDSNSPIMYNSVSGTLTIEKVTKNTISGHFRFETYRTKSGKILYDTPSITVSGQFEAVPANSLPKAN